MATADAETTVVPETDIHHQQPIENKTTEEETDNELTIPSSNKDGSVKQLEEEEEAPTEDKLPVVTEVHEPPKLEEEVPAKTSSKQVAQESKQPEAVTTAQVQALEAAEIEADNKMVPEENPSLDDDGVAEETTEKPAVEAALEGELEERPHLESDSNKKEEVFEGEVQQMVEAEGKTESLAVESESKEVPTLEADENQLKKIEAIEKCEGEAINPITTTEAADEQAQTVDDVPAQESNLDIKKEPEETLKTQSLEAEAEQTNGIDQVVDAPKGEPQEVKDDAEEVEAKITEEVAEEDGTISAAPKSIIIAETSVPQVEAECDIKQAGVHKFVSESENTVATEINNAAHETVAVEEIAREDGKVEEGNQGNDANVEKVGSLNEGEEVPGRSFEGKQVSRDLEVFKEGGAKELEEEKTGSVEPEIGSKDPPTVEETVKDVANESQPTMATAAEETKATFVEHDTKAKQELSTTTEVVVKSTHKSSGNIISKMKQSLVKVKKAITRKSPSSKT